MDAGISLLWAAMRSRYEERGVGSRGGESKRFVCSSHNLQSSRLPKTIGRAQYEPKKNTQERVRSV